MITPPICGKRRWFDDSGIRPHDRRYAAEPMVNPRAVEIVLEGVEFALEIFGMPEGNLIEKVASHRADQPLDEWVRHRYEGYGFDLRDLENSQVRLPAVEFKKWIVVGAQGGWISRYPGDYSVEHATDRWTVEYAGVDREPDDAP